MMIEQDTSQTGRRRAPRLRVRLTGSSITRAGNSKITFHNISRCGAMVELEGMIAELREGSQMVILGPDLELFGEVRRLNGRLVAIEFDEELSNEELLRLRVISERMPTLDETRMWRNQARDWVSGVGGRAGMD